MRHLIFFVCAASLAFDLGIEVRLIEANPKVEEGRNLRGVAILEGDAHITPSGNWSGQLYRSIHPGTSPIVKLRMIPYYAWGNRGLPYISVWLPLAR